MKLQRTQYELYIFSRYSRTKYYKKRLFIFNTPYPMSGELERAEFSQKTASQR